MSAPKKLTRAGLRREVRAMAIELADAFVDMVEAQGLFSEAEAPSEDDLPPPRVRRSPSDLEAWKGRILAALRRHDEPVAVGVVAEELGTSSRQLTHLMGLLVEAGEVIRSGTRRGARYRLRRRAPKKSPSRRPTKTTADRSRRR